jgi:hypothetical protein
MDAWTVFGAIKLFLDIIDGGPSAIVKGVLMSGIPYSTAIDVGEVVFGLFDLNGNYSEEIVLQEDQYISLNSLTLLNKDDLETSLSELNFPTLAKLEFAKMESRKFPEF